MDEFHGQGGAYIIDKDGKRVLVERTGEGESKNLETNAPANYTKAKKNQKASENLNA